MLTRQVRLLVVMCLTACLAAIPWNDALAREPTTEESASQSPVDGSGNGEAQVAPETMTKDVREAQAPNGEQIAATVVELSVLGAMTQSFALKGSPAAWDVENRNREVPPAAYRLVPTGPSQLARASQTVASKNKTNFLVGLMAAGLVVGGVALLAYGTTQSCQAGDPTGGTCDHDKVWGAVGVSAGSLMLVVWALSR